MLQRIISILLVFSPVLTSAQTIEWGTPAYDEIIKADCEYGNLFTKYEELASFKISKEAFEDSMTVYLKANNAFDAKTKFIGQFVLTKGSRILNFEKIRGTFININYEFEKALVRFSKLWLPAKQNSREVCAYVRCEFEVKEDRLTVTLIDTKKPLDSQ